MPERLLLTIAWEVSVSSKGEDELYDMLFGLKFRTHPARTIERYNHGDEHFVERLHL
jgi:hypothetical protein